MLARRARAAPLPQPPPSGFPVACVRSCVVAVVHHGRTCAFVRCESREEPWSSKYGRHMAAESDEVGEVSDIASGNSVAVRALAGGHCRSRHPATTTSAAALTAPPPPSDRLATAELEASTLIFGRSGGAPRRARLCAEHLVWVPRAGWVLGWHIGRLTWGIVGIPGPFSATCALNSARHSLELLLDTCAASRLHLSRPPLQVSCHPNDTIER